MIIIMMVMIMIEICTNLKVCTVLKKVNYVQIIVTVRSSLFIFLCLYRDVCNWIHRLARLD